MQKCYLGLNFILLLMVYLEKILLFQQAHM